MKNNKFLSTPVLWGIAGVIIGLVVVFLYFSYPGSQGTADISGTDSTSGAQGTSGGSTAAAPKIYTNLQYGYSVKYPGDAQNSVSHPDAVTFTFNGVTPAKGVLAINIANDITHTAYCLSTPAGATGVATTTTNGVAFHRYTGTSPSDTSGITHYKALRKAINGIGSVCFDIQKSNTATAAIGAKLDTILNSLTFK